MIAPLSWLKDYVDIDITPQELEDKLFSCGFEVEELYEIGTKGKREIYRAFGFGLHSAKCLRYKSRD